MKPEPPHIEAFARFLCKRRGGNPDHLEPGSLAYHSSLDPSVFHEGGYDAMLLSDPDYMPDGFLRNGDPAMFYWRQYVMEAAEILLFLDGLGLFN